MIREIGNGEGDRQKCRIVTAKGKSLVCERERETWNMADVGATCATKVINGRSADKANVCRRWYHRDTVNPLEFASKAMIFVCFASLSRF
ncbi:MAG: hypothetical protein RDA78_19745 [Roseibium sp.]|uniref:hypothetical protein n=1 Tax=Roseibium sp. TaxID=1936156 RepID=UPI003D9C66D0